MALDASALASALQGALTIEVSVPTVDQEGKLAGTQRVRSAPDEAAIQRFCDVLISYFKANTEVIIPDLVVEIQSTSQGSGNVSGNTGSGGDPSHSHSFGSGVTTNVPINITTVAQGADVKGHIE